MKKRLTITLFIITAALIVPLTLLTQLSVDVSLRQWHKDSDGYQLALQEQKLSGKPLLALFFHTDWCSNCKQLRETVLSSDPFKQFLSSVILVKINPEYASAERAIANRFGVIGYPTFLLVTAKSSNDRIIPIRCTSNVKPEDFVKACETALLI